MNCDSVCLRNALTNTALIHDTQRHNTFLHAKHRYFPPDGWLVCRIISAAETKDGSRSVSARNTSVKRGRVLPFVRRSQGKWELTECSQPSSARGPSSGLNWLWVNYRGRGTESLSPRHSDHSHNGVVNVKYRLHLGNGPQFGNLSAHTLVILCFWPTSSILCCFLSTLLCSYHLINKIKQRFTHFYFSVS